MATSGALSRRGFVSGLLSSTVGVAVLAACGGAAPSAGTTAPAPTTAGAAPTAAPAAAQATTAPAATSAAAAAPTTAAAAQPTAAAGTSAAAGTIRVALAGLDVGEVKVWQGIADAFHQQNPNVTAKIENVPDTPYQKYETEMAGGAGHDVYDMETKQLPAFAGKGVFASLDSYVATSKTTAPAAFFYTPWQKCIIQGKLYGIPWDTSPATIFYSIDLFQEAGIKPPPNDWDDKTWTRDAFMDTVTKLTKGTGPNKQFGWFQSTWWVYGFPWLWSNGGHAFDQKIQKATLTDQKVIDTWQFLQDLMWKQKVWPSAQESTQGADVMFLTGKIGMYLNGPYFIPALRNGKAKVKWNVGVIPSGTAGRWTRDPADALSTWKDSKLKDAAWAWTEFFCGATGEQMLGKGGYVPVRREVATSKDFLEQGDGVDWKVIVGGIDHEGVQPITDVWPEVDNTMRQGLGNVFNNKQSAKDALTALQPQIQAIIDKATVRRDRPTYSDTAGWSAPPKE